MNTTQEKLKQNKSIETPTFEIRQKKRRRAKLSKLKRKIFKHIWLVRGFIFSICIAVMIVVMSFMIGIFNSSDEAENYKLIKNFILKPVSDLNSTNGRVNLLILGKGGENHTASDLTDTIILVSIKERTNEIQIISIPRDIWITELRTKINSVYYWGEQKRESGGTALMKSVIEDMLGIPVHYTLVVDFDGFKEIIDEIGGVDVPVSVSFVDNKYPIPGRENDDCLESEKVAIVEEFPCRYETVIFEKGLVHMDGNTALKFVRSRNADGDEGTDIARSRRQREVLAAIKDKVTSREILLSRSKIENLKQTFIDNSKIDLTIEQMAIILRIFYDSKDNVSSHVIPDDLLERPKIANEYDGLYVFIPKGGSWEDIQKWIDEIID